MLYRYFIIFISVLAFIILISLPVYILTNLLFILVRSPYYMTFSQSFLGTMFGLFVYCAIKNITKERK